MDELIKLYESDIKHYKEEIKDLQKEIDKRNALIETKRKYAREIKNREVER